jgi:hypothetical protein
VLYHSIYPSVVGYICAEEFTPHPLFNKEGKPTSEACPEGFKRNKCGSGKNGKISDDLKRF